MSVRVFAGLAAIVLALSLANSAVPQSALSDPPTTGNTEFWDADGAQIARVVGSDLYFPEKNVLLKDVTFAEFPSDRITAVMPGRLVPLLSDPVAQYVARTGDIRAAGRHEGPRNRLNLIRLDDARLWRQIAYEPPDDVLSGTLRTGLAPTRIIAASGTGCALLEGMGYAPDLVYSFPADASLYVSATTASRLARTACRADGSSVTVVKMYIDQTDPALLGVCALSLGRLDVKSCVSPKIVGSIEFPPSWRSQEGFWTIAHVFLLHGHRVVVVAGGGVGVFSLPAECVTGAGCEDRPLNWEFLFEFPSNSRTTRVDTVYPALAEDGRDLLLVRKANRFTWLHASDAGLRRSGEGQFDCRPADWVLMRFVDLSSPNLPRIESACLVKGSRDVVASINSIEAGPRRGEVGVRWLAGPQEIIAAQSFRPRVQ